MLAGAIHQIRLFFIALQFFTRLPIPGWVGFDVAWLQQSVRYFPLVGVVVGGLVAGCYWLFAHIWPQAVALILASAFGILLTGAFHEDGFADMCDGFGGGMSVQRVLEIMVDSRIGAYGAIGIVLMLASKLAALICLPADKVVAALLLAHPLSRLASCALIWRLSYVKGEGKAKPLAQQMSSSEWSVACLSILLCCGPLYWYLPLLGLGWAVVAASCVAGWMGYRMWRRIGGYTGDCLGATQQVAEVAIYLALLAVLARSAL